MAQKKYYHTFKVIAFIALPLSFLLSVGLALDTAGHIVSSMEKNIKSNILKEFFKCFIYASFAVFALLLLILAASQTVKTTLRTMEEFGNRMDIKDIKKNLGIDYYLDVVEKLRKEANKLKQSAQDNYAEINRKFRKKTINFPLSQSDYDSNATLFQEIDFALKRCKKWLYKLDIADGDVQDGRCTSYYSASEKLMIAIDRLNIARDLLATHRSIVFNFKKKHDELANTITDDKDHIIGLQSRIRLLKKDIIKIYRELELFSVSLKNESYEEFLPKQSRLIDRESTTIFQSNEEKQKPKYQKRFEKDKLLPIRFDSDLTNQCISDIKNGDTLAKVECCPFFIHYETELLKLDKGKMAAVSSPFGIISTSGESSNSSSSLVREDESTPLLVS